MDLISNTVFKKLNVLFVALKMADIGLLFNETVAIKLLFSYPSAWLSGYEDPVVSRINMRIQDLTGLDVSTAEELQVSYHRFLQLFPLLQEAPPVRFPDTEQQAVLVLCNTWGL